MSLDQSLNENYDQISEKDHYLAPTSLWQTVMFTWISPLLSYGSRHALDEKAVPYLRAENKPKIQLDALQKIFDETKKSKIQGWTLGKSILKGFKKDFCLIFIFCLISCAFGMYLPILTNDVIHFIDDKNRQIQTAVFYFISIFVVALIRAFTWQFTNYHFSVLGFNLSNTLSLMIYNKTLKYPLIAEKQFAISDIINYSQVDAERMTNMGFQLIGIVFAPFQIIIGLYLLYAYVGPASLVGVATMIVLIFVTLVLTKISGTAYDKLMIDKDARMKDTEEILQIIKFIKINSLEKYFFQKINRKREAELKLNKKVHLCNIAETFVFWLCPPLIVSFTFLLYVHLGEEITAAKAFLTIIIFNILQYPMNMFPNAIFEIVQIWTSLRRIEKFLFIEELSRDCIKEELSSDCKYAIEVKNGHFLWGKEKEDKEKEEEKDKEKEKEDKEKKEEDQKNDIGNDIGNFTENMRQSLISVISVDQEMQSNLDEEKNSKYIKALTDININFTAKAVTMIIGEIGSGKSSLLFAILNQMKPDPKYAPKINIYGSIAYAPQRPWIMSGTVKENIVFFLPLDEKRLKEAIHYACLEDDLKLLNKGVQTEIGQKGVNLSGGQKARISLARALYADRDIYLLDDILSSVDVHVGNFLMEETILKYLKGKTVIMPTHAIKYLQKSDAVVIMKKGKIVASGSPETLNGYNEYLKIVNSSKKKKVSEKEQEIVKDLTKQAAREEIKKEPFQDNPTDGQLILPEDHEKGAVSKEVYRTYIELNGGCPFVVGVFSCLTLWAVLFSLSNIQIERWSEDAKDISHLYYYLGFALSAAVFSGVRAYIIVLSGVRQGRIIHKRVMKSLLYASITNFYNRIPVGRILNRLSKDLKEIDDSLGYVVGGFLIDLFCLLACLAICVYASTPLVIIPIAFVLVICNKLKDYYLKTQRECVRLQNITASPIVQGFTSMVNGVGTIRAYQLSKQFFEHQISKIDTNKRMRIAREAMESWFSLRLSLMSFFINMSAIGYCLFSQNTNASLAGLLLAYSMTINDDIINTTFSYAFLETKMIAIQRLKMLTKIEPEPGYAEYCKDWWTREEGSDLESVKNGSIKFVNFSSKYREGLPLVLRNINLAIGHGEKVGVVGRTGAGKSTLFNSLLRIIEPSQGAILIDDKSTQQYNLKDLRACITMIEQEPTLMSQSFRQNLDPAHHYSEEELLEVLRQCNLHEMVQEKGGLDGKISNDNLSVGQRQLVCICRAFLKKSKIILIDEATANIDMKNDQLIQEVISAKFKQSTVLTIAHRLTTLKDCDKILMLDEGSVLEFGDTQELMKNPKSAYRKMCEQNDASYLA